MDDERRRVQLPERLRLMVITDRLIAGESRWLSVVESALQAGATAIQLRDKEASSGELLDLARALRPLCHRHGALFVVNDRLDVALAADADGVHLGADDLPVAAARQVVPRDFIVGFSADTVDAARAAEAEGADYLGVGSVFGTRTKREVAGEAIGTDQLARVADAVSIPIVAVGGVSAANAEEVARAGADGVAVVSAVMAAADPAAATRELIQSLMRSSKQ